MAPVPAPTAAVVPSPAPSSLVGSGRDNLQRIGGINAEIEKLLHVQGVTRYGQIAQWDALAIDRFDRLLGYQGRIKRENWIEQAQILAKGGDTAYSRETDRRSQSAQKPGEGIPRPARLAEAIRENEPRDQPQRTPDLSGLRSVRSEAFRPSDAASGSRNARSTVPDDLKRIRGIGVLIEKKLNSMGITSYDQIANWSAGDIDRVSHVLDFKGRIERENWVEQARILASGGQTEFSRRADRDGDQERD